VHKNSYTLFFAAVITISCSLLLTSAATLLKDRQQENVALDKQKNILICAGLTSSDDQGLTRQKILETYEKNIKSMVLDLKGEEVPDKDAALLNPKKDTDLLPLYFCESNGAITIYIIPISGKGLWSTIYGYIALGTDVNTVNGITFYKHGETPGLGGEIEKDWFTGSFVNKKILAPDGKLISITVVKGKVADKIPADQADHYVDGISGSTLTGNGINNFLKENLQKYEPYLKEVRKLETE